MDEFRMLICDTDGREISPRKLFGKKVQDVKKAMVSIMKYGQGDETRYEGCYKAPDVPYIMYEMCCPDKSFSYSEWKEMMYPKECELERLSYFNRDQQIVKCFRLVYGAARKNGFVLEWQGNVDGEKNEPDCWTVIKQQKVYGYIQLV